MYLSKLPLPFPLPLALFFSFFIFFWGLAVFGKKIVPDRVEKDRLTVSEKSKFAVGEFKFADD